MFSSSHLIETDPFLKSSEDRIFLCNSIFVTVPSIIISSNDLRARLIAWSLSRPVTISFASKLS